MWWSVSIWAATRQNSTKWLCVSEDSEQPGHPPSLIRVFAICMKKAWILSYPWIAHRRLCSDWADAQADLSLRWVHTHFVGFVMSRLIMSSLVKSLWKCILWHVCSPQPRVPFEKEGGIRTRVSFWIWHLKLKTFMYFQRGCVFLKISQIMWCQKGYFLSLGLKKGYAFSFKRSLTKRGFNACLMHMFTRRMSECHTLSQSSACSLRDAKM